MGKLEDMEAKLEAMRSADADARRARDEAEAEDVFGALMADLTRRRVAVPEAAPEHPGSVVLRCPTAAEYKRVLHVLSMDRALPETVEERARIGSITAAACVVWPPRERYEALVRAYPAVGERCGATAIGMAEAGARATEKK